MSGKVLEELFLAFVRVNGTPLGSVNSTHNVDLSNVAESNVKHLLRALVLQPMIEHFVNRKLLPLTCPFGHLFLGSESIQAIFG